MQAALCRTRYSRSVAQSIWRLSYGQRDPEFEFVEGKENRSPCPQCQYRLWSPPILRSVGTGADRPPPSRAEIKNEWILPPLPLHAFVGASQPLCTFFPYTLRLTHNWTEIQELGFVASWLLDVTWSFCSEHSRIVPQNVLPVFRLISPYMSSS